MDSDLHLEEFEAANREVWRNAAAAALKGESIEKKLFSMTPEGIQLQPIYDQTDLDCIEFSETWPGMAPFARGSTAAGHKLERWWIAQDLYSDDAADYNRQLTDELMLGRNAVVLPLDDETREGSVLGKGIALRTVTDLQTALHGIDLNAAPLLTWAGFSALPFIGMLEASLDGASWRGAVLADPISESMLGQPLMGMSDCLDEMAKVSSWAIQSQLDVRTIGVQGHLWGDAGANAVEELAYTLATSVEYLKAMVARGFSASEVCEQFVFSLSLSSDVFMQISKLRAARLLWSKVLACYDGAQSPLFIHCRSCRFNKSLLDVRSNILRATVEAFAGVVSGANSMHISPYDEVAGGNDMGARRLARNTQLMMAEECGFSEVADAAGGSWYIESLTDQLARKAWARFQEIEAQGGMSVSLAKGIPQQSVQETSQERLTRMSQRLQWMVGVNLSPDADEKFVRPASSKNKPTMKPDITLNRPDLGILASVEEVTQVFREGVSLPEVRMRLGRSAHPEKGIAPLCFPRASQGYEALRSSVTKHWETSGQRPAIWLAKFGSPKQWTARAEFTRGFFGIGGYQIKESLGGSHTIDDALQAASNSLAQVVVLCATDNDYVEIVSNFVPRLKQRCPKVHVILAGYPVDHLEDYQQAGVDSFIHIRTECLSFLRQLNQDLGIISE